MKPVLEPWTLAQARALWWQKQAIGDAIRKGPLASVLGAAGWLRTLGGSDVYLAARARRPGLGRAELDSGRRLARDLPQHADLAHLRR